MLDSQQEHKRKRKRTFSSTSETTATRKPTTSTLQRKGLDHSSAILSGWTLAISTLDVKGEQHENRDLSYKTIRSLATNTELGATVTHQVHKRVSALLCTEASVRNTTQRVRKAIRHGIPLVDVSWLYACHEHQTVVDIQNHTLDHEALTQQPSTKVKKDGSGGLNPDYEQTPEEGWTDAVELGCCCVCHENLDPICPWCTTPGSECSINKRLPGESKLVSATNPMGDMCSDEKRKSIVQEQDAIKKKRTTKRKKKRRKIEGT